MHPTLDSFVAVPMSQDLFMRLASRFPAGAASIVEQVIEDFLERTKDDYAPSDQNPFIWDQLRLPSGTKVRTKHYGDYQIAEVQDGKVYWDGEEFKSMSQLARSMRGNTSNNAWVVLEIQYPGQTDWTLADRLRK
jgi:hypothetical protein